MAWWQYQRPIPRLLATQTVRATERVPGSAPVMPWPAGGEAALGVIGIGQIGAGGGTAPLPIASVAKVVTALTVVKEKPLGADSQGPEITVTADDVASYRREAADGQSVVRVSEGEQVSERQALEGLLIPSGNNLADLLARWDAGSLEAFLPRLAAEVKALGMKQTHFADASGYSEQTVSTPSDLLLAGEALEADPVLSEIVAMPQADFPGVGVVYNVDYALGRQGLDGIKTGSAPKAGACFLFSAPATAFGRQVRVVGAVLGLPTLDDAFAAATALIARVGAGLVRVLVVAAAQPVGEYRAPWGARAGLIAGSDLELLGWPGLILHRRLRAGPGQAGEPAETVAGELEAWVGDGRSPTTVAVSTDAGLFPPGTLWRLTRYPPG